MSAIRALISVDADGTLSFLSFGTWWIDSEGDTSSFRSSTKSIIYDSTVRMFSLCCLRGGRKPCANCFSAAVESGTGHSSRSTELVSGNVIVCHTADAVKGFPHDLNLQSGYPDFDLL